MDEHVIQLDFSLEELKAIVAILNAYIKHSLRLMSTLSEKRRTREWKRSARITITKTKLNRQILSGNVGLILSDVDIKDIIHAIKVYKGFVITMFPANEERDQVLETASLWQERFENVLAAIQPEPETET